MRRCREKKQRSYIRGTFFDDSSDRNEHIFIGTLEQFRQQRNDTGTLHGMLVPIRSTETPESQSPGSSNFDIFSILTVREMRSRSMATDRSILQQGDLHDTVKDSEPRPR